MRISTASSTRSREPSPGRAALEFCKWVTENVKYDASVPYGSRDLPSILTHKKGHCGHQLTMFEAMCLRAGIPTRTVVGLNLNTPGGIGPLHEIRPDFQNQHTWAQVYLPGSGWIEIDPGMASKGLFSSSPSHPEQHRFPELRHLDL